MYPLGPGIRDEFLRSRYKGSDPEDHYLYFTLDDRNANKELSEVYESMRAWSFGKVG